MQIRLLQAYFLILPLLPPECLRFPLLPWVQNLHGQTQVHFQILRSTGLTKHIPEAAPSLPGAVMIFVIAVLVIVIINLIIRNRKASEEEAYDDEPQGRNQKHLHKAQEMQRKEHGEPLFIIDAF